MDKESIASHHSVGDHYRLHPSHINRTSVVAMAAT